MIERLPRVCVIGAGSSGIAACKALWDRNIPFACFEASDRIGGNWVIGNKNGMSAAYRSLHINTSRPRMEYADFPMPVDYPDFPHHTLIARYFEAYVDRFGFRDQIRFETRVTRAELDDAGLWRITTGDGREETFDALCVCNGHHWDPRWPDPPIPGPFYGIEMHSHAYLDPTEPEDLRDKRVVVVGMGNSAMDIAVELASGPAARVMLAARRGAHIIPNYLFGRPVDQYVLPIALPFALRARVIAAGLRLAVGKMEDYGLPRPDHRLGQAHPTISSEILASLGRGDITPKPNIKAKHGDGVEFADGSTEPADAIIYCTGYKVSFPFFDPAFLSAPENDLPLYRRVIPPAIPGLFFIGLLQPLGAIMPIAEAQSAWMAEILAGRAALPSEATMNRVIARDRKRLEKRYVASPRHTMQVDFDDYMSVLARERKRGHRRAARLGNPLPIRARAAKRSARSPR